MKVISEKNKLDEIARLKKMNQTKARVFAIVAHNVLAPLRFMSGITDFSLENWDTMNNDDLKRCAMIMKESSQSLLELSTAVMEWSKNELNIENQKKETINFYDLIENERGFFGGQIDGKKIKLVNNIDDNISIQGHVAITRLVFQNLISNAIKFSNRNQSILIEAFKEKNELRIDVVDSGIGMNTKELKKLNDIHDRFTNRGTDNEEGFGMGLLMVRDLLYQNNADLVISSKPVKGTRASVVYKLS